MQENLHSHYLRITNCNKLSDRFLTVQAREPSSDSKNKKGKVFALIEIMAPWNPNAHIGQTIINTLVKEYYKANNANQLLNFENSLKKVNEKLVQVTQNGDADWIGKINATLFIIHKNNIHIAHTGKLHGYLIRDNKILPVINSKEQYRYNHPLKTFSSVISGVLQKNDNLFFSTNLLFDYIDTKNLNQLFRSNTLSESGNQIANILKTKNTKYSNCLLINISDKETRTDEQDVIYLDEERLTAFYQSTKTNFNKYSKIYLKNFVEFSKKSWDSINSFTKSNLPKAKNMVEKISKNTQDKLSKLNNQNANNNTNTGPNINHYNSTQKLSKYFKKTIDFITKSFRHISKFIKNSLKPENRGKTLKLTIIILLAIFIANIGYIANKNQTKQENTQINKELDQMEDKKDDISLLIISGDYQKAKTLIAELKTQINIKDKELQDNKSAKDRLTTLSNDLLNQEDKVFNITRLTNFEKITQSDNAKKMFYTNNKLYIYNENKISLVDNGNPKELTQIPQSNLPIINLFTSNNKLYVLTKSMVYELQDEKLIETKSLENEISHGEIYNNSLYLASSTKSAMYKSSLDSGISNPTSYLSENIDLTNLSSITIDGFIYLLNNNGSVSKLSLGKKVNFELKNSPQLTNYQKIYTDMDSQYIYILAEDKIVLFDKNGNYLKQYAFSNHKNITDFKINKNSIDIISDSTVYNYSI